MNSRRTLPYVRLGDHCDVIRGISWERDCESSSGIPALTIPNVQSTLDLSKLTHLAGIPENHVKKARVRGGHTIMVGSNGNKSRVGDCIYFPNDTQYVFASFLMGIRPHEDSGLDSRYVYYWLRSPEFREPIQASLIGATSLGNLRVSALRDVMVPSPPLLIQRRIAGILSAYDELIENSQRRIKILETMARTLYREWFVHFRFPGHESVPRVPSPLGDIPQGWEPVSFQRLLKSMTGGDWGSEQPEDRETEAVIVVRGTDFDEVAYGGQLRSPVRYIKPSSLASRGLKVGDVIIENSINAKSRSAGTTLLVDNHVLNRLGQEAIAASFCKVFRPHDRRVAPLIHLHARHLREDGRMEYYQNVAANGIANFQAQKFAKEEHLVLPSTEAERTKLIEPISALFEDVAVLASQLSNLRRTRDLLLPRLLSGQIDVEAMPS
jgi:type I restriction enzyme S subunit